MIQLSCVGFTYCPNFLVSSIYFWEGSTNSFHFPFGMLTPTLFDVVEITGLRPTGDSFKPTTADESVIQFDKEAASFTKYIECFHKKQVSSVSDEEHIAFLALWVSKYVFCCCYVKVAKRFIALAHQLHQGRDMCLSELIMGFLYESLSKWATFMPLDPKKPNNNYFLAGPFWLLQLWLNATFSRRLHIHLTDAYEVAFDQRTTEGRRLFAMTPKDQDLTLEEALKKYLLLFFRCTKFTPHLAPFTFRTHGPEWFTRAFPPKYSSLLSGPKDI